MAATAEAVPDEVRRWWENFSNGPAVDQGEYEEPEPEVEVDSDFEFERVAVEEERNAHARVEEQSIDAAAASRHCEDVYTAEDNYAQIGGGLLLGRQMESPAAPDKLHPITGTEIEVKKCSVYKNDHQVVVEKENVGVAMSERDGKMTVAAQAPVEEPSRDCAADRHCDGEYIAEYSYAQIGDRLLQRRNVEATVTASKPQPTTGPEIHDKICSGYEKDHQVAAEEENVGVAVSESDGKMTVAAQETVEEPSSGGAADCHCDEEEVSGDCYVQLQGGLLGRKRKASASLAEPQTTGIDNQEEQGHEGYVSWDCYVQLQGGFLGRKRKAIATHAEPQTTGTEIRDEKGEHISDDNGAPTGVGLQGRKREATVTPGKVQTATGHDKGAQGGYLRAENEMLRQQLMRKTKELGAEAEKIRRLKLELDVKDNEELRCKREHYRKIAKPPRNTSLFCNEHALGQDCSERHGSASSEQHEGDDSY